MPGLLINWLGILSQNGAFNAIILYSCTSMYVSSKFFFSFLGKLGTGRPGDRGDWGDGLKRG